MSRFRRRISYFRSKDYGIGAENFYNHQRALRLTNEEPKYYTAARLNKQDVAGTQV